jgi:predicted dehydrogenase
MPVRVAVVGLGHMGRLHLQKLLQMKDVEVVALCDKEEGRRRDYPSFPFFSDPYELPSICDAVLLCTPATTHYGLARRFLEEKRHVFVEKPLATRSEEAKELVEMAKKKGVVLRTGFIERFNPTFRRALSMRLSPFFVEISRQTAFTGRGTDVSVVMDLMIHDIDLSLLLLGGNIKDLSAFGLSLVTDKVDVACADIFLEDGGRLCLKTSRIAPVQRREMLVYEDGRSLLFDLLNGRIAVRQKEGGYEEEIGRADPLKDELSEFFSAVLGSTCNPVDETPIFSIRVAEEIERRLGKVR